jgi:phosphatidylglycerol:prolipoprotein diacylglycerol transferase
MATTSSYWVHDLSPFLIRFPENPLGIDGIRYYGLAYLLGFIAAWALLRMYNARGKFAIDADARATLMTAVILGVLLGGRLGYMLLYDLDAFLQNPLHLLRVDQGGMASHGGFVGVLLALVWFARKYKYPFFELGDVIVTLAPLGLCFGRIANFINGELWGRVTDVSWAVIFPGSPTVYDATLHMFMPEPRHPSQLYAALLEGALLFAYAQWRFWRTNPPAGQLGGEFLIGYGIVRIFDELFREPDAALILGLSRGQFYSIFIIIAGVAIIRIARRKQSAQRTMSS